MISATYFQLFQEKQSEGKKSKCYKIVQSRWKFMGVKKSSSQDMTVMKDDRPPISHVSAFALLDTSTEVP